VSWSALILAGSRGPSDPVAIAAGVAHKAMAELAGRPMIDHVVETLRSVPRIDRIAVSGAPDLPLPPDVEILPTAATPASSVLAAFDALRTPLLVTTADNPLLSVETVNAFLRAATASGADAAAGICRREIVEQAGNPARRTYLKFRDGAVSGCNLFAFTDPAGRAAADFWRRLETRRKRPWRMAREIGPGVLACYLTGFLSMRGAASAISRAAGCRAAMIPLEDPFAAHDVDRLDDLIFAERVLSRRKPPS